MVPPSIVFISLRSLCPARSAIVGKTSAKETGVSENELGSIFGPETMKGILIPPSVASHLPLLRG